MPQFAGVLNNFKPVKAHYHCKRCDTEWATGDPATTLCWLCGEPGIPGKYPNYEPKE